jgi:signal transduction histidine kinase
LVIFAFLHRFVSQDIQLRSDAWLSGEVEVLGDVAERTPKDTLYSRVVSEIAELASKEVPDKLRSNDALNDSVFFLMTGPDNSLGLWVGQGEGQKYLQAIRSARILPGFPSDLHVVGFSTPFRVVSDHLDNGSVIYLGLSERDELRVLRNLRLLFLLLGLLIVLFGSAIVFYTTRRMLGHVRKITDAASRIGESDLSSRVPTTNRHDEVGQLAFTLNRMLDRIQSSVHQLHTITDSLAHDLRSPLTAIRAKLEMSLTNGASGQDFESIVTAIEEIDRITDFLNKSLDVAEANADALRLERVTLDVEEVLQVMMDLYEPCMAERGLRIRFNSSGPTPISADAALIHRMIANLFDNESKHVPAASTVTISVRSREAVAVLTIEDDGPGFPPEIAEHLFERSVRGPSSRGHGMGLAFVEAVVRAHNGSIEASNRVEGGARITITFPLVNGVHSLEATPELVLEHRH